MQSNKCFCKLCYVDIRSLIRFYTLDCLLASELRVIST